MSSILYAIPSSSSLVRPRRRSRPVKGFFTLALCFTAYILVSLRPSYYPQHHLPSHVARELQQNLQQIVAVQQGYSRQDGFAQEVPFYTEPGTYAWRSLFDLLPTKQKLYYTGAVYLHKMGGLVKHRDSLESTDSEVLRWYQALDPYSAARLDQGYTYFGFGQGMDPPGGPFHLTAKLYQHAARL